MFRRAPAVGGKLGPVSSEVGELVVAAGLIQDAEPPLLCVDVTARAEELGRWRAPGGCGSFRRDSECFARRRGRLPGEPT